MVYGTSMGDLGLLSKVQVLITVIFLMEATRIYLVLFINEKCKDPFHAKFIREN